MNMEQPPKNVKRVIGPISPDLERHLHKVHFMSLQVAALAEALCATLDNPDLKGTNTEIVEGLRCLAKSVVQGLDTPELIEVE